MSIVLVILSFILCISYGSATGRLYTYYENSSPISWLRAADLCVEHGKSLATFITENDRINLMNAIGQKRAYIGLNDRGTENIWTWIDGTQCESGHGNLCIAEWKIGEPNGSGDCSEMTGGLVDDLNCDADYFWIDGYVCNDPTPSPTSRPTSPPTRNPTPEPTNTPTPAPTNNPTPSPTDQPTQTIYGDNVIFSDGSIFPFDEITMETFDTIPIPIGWIKIASCSEGWGTLLNEIYNNNDTYKLASKAKTAKIVPPQGKQHSNYDSYAVIAKPGSTAILNGLNNGRCFGSADSAEWIGSNQAKTRLGHTNCWEDGVISGHMPPYYYWANGNPKGIHIMKNAACFWDYDNILGTDIAVYFGYFTNATTMQPTAEPTPAPTINPTPGQNWKHVSIGSDGSVWGLSSNENIYRYEGGNKWSKIGGSLKQISVGSSQNIYGVNNVNDIWKWHGTEQDVGNKWTKIYGAKLQHISVGYDGTIWGINSMEEIFRYEGGNQWNKMPGLLKLKQISVGSAHHIYGINNFDDIYKWIENDNNWIKMTGKLRYIDVSSDGDVWGVNNNNEVFRYICNGNWQRMDGIGSFPKLKQIESNNGKIIGITLDNKIYETSKSTNPGCSSAESNGLRNIDGFYNMNNNVENNKDIISIYIWYILGILIVINGICIIVYYYQNKEKSKYKTVSIYSTDDIDTDAEILINQ